MKWLIFFASLLVVFITGCHPRVSGREIYFRSFASCFFETEGIDVAKNRQSNTVLDVYIHQAWSLGSYESVGAHKERYDEFCQKYGDMSYDRVEYMVAGDEYSRSFQHSFLGYSFVSVDIVSDAAFDAQHPAGTSLADIVIYDGQSSKPFIDSGYQMCYWDDSDKFDYEPQEEHLRPYYPVFKRVSEVSVDDLKMIYLARYSSRPVAFIRFEQAPTLSKEHNFTVTCTDERGKVFSDSIRMTFE